MESLKYTTLGEALRATAQKSSSGITFLNGDESIFVSYRALFDKALLLTGYLQESGFVPGNEFIIYDDDNRRFLHTYWGLLLGGFVPVPVAVRNSPEHIAKLFKIRDILSSPPVITSHEILARLAARGREYGVSSLVDDMSAQAVLPASYESSQRVGIFHKGNENDCAFIQFSSGTTGNPKGVTLTHRNILTNIRAIIRGAALSDDDTYLSWMPLSHDMGLIGNHLVPLCMGGQQYCMPTLDFLMHPRRWIDNASVLHATVLSSPNFGYRHFLSSFNQGGAFGWDLSRVRLIFNGAEPISADLCDEFLNALAPYGLGPCVMYPVYGLAEATLAVTFPEPGEALRRVVLDRRKLGTGCVVKSVNASSRNAVVFLDVGRPLENCDLRIVDESGSCLADDTIGVIHIKGDNVTAGYYHDREATDAVHASDGWLNTGDLGFMRDDRLVVTGRVKDVIFVNGQNYYSHDVERVALKVPGIELGKIAAVGASTGASKEDAVVLFVQHRDPSAESFTDLAETLVRRISAELELQVAHVIPVRSIPKTTSGKTQRALLRDRYMKGEFDEIISARRVSGEIHRETESGQNTSGAHFPDVLRSWIIGRIAAVLGLPVESIDPDRPFAEFGLSSLKAVKLAAELEEYLGAPFTPTDLYDYPTINRLVMSLDHTRYSPRSVLSATGTGVNEPVAIVGMGCRFPGASSPQEFWELIAKGRDLITRVPEERWSADRDIHGADGAPESRGSMWGGFIEEVDLFDPLFFGISPHEARMMDPQQRLLLMVAWEALEHAGIAPGSLAGSPTGVFIGISSRDYWSIQSAGDRPVSGHAGTGNAASIAANRLSYFFDFKGPSMAIDTACSSSLVAVHLAVKDLRAGECDLALAGGVNLILSPEISEIFESAGMLSPDGRCRAFDAQAGGYVRGEGCGLVILKRLVDAERDGNRILSVIAGSAVNQDGRSNGLTAPNGISQKDVIRKALDNARVSPGDISYVEAHGTGTPLGDPIEMNALIDVLDGRGHHRSPCLIGSVKTNIGHLESAAGIAGLIKAVLVLRHGMAPPLLHFKKINPLISLTGTAFALTDRLMPIASSGDHLFAGVSSFGFGGTNAHVVLKQYHDKDMTLETKGPLAFLISARDGNGVVECAKRLLQQCESRFPEPGYLSNLAYTLQCGREHMDERLAFVVTGIGDLTAMLTKICSDDARLDGVCFSGNARSGRRSSGETRISEEKITELAKAAQLHQLCRLWARGASINWKLLHEDGMCRFVDAPTYFFSCKRFWISEVRSPQRRREITTGSQQPELELYRPVWRLSDLPARNRHPDPERTVLLLDVDESIAGYLSQNTGPVIMVRAGSVCQRKDDGYEIDPGNREHYDWLMRTMKEQGCKRIDVVVRWSRHCDKSGDCDAETRLAFGFYALYYLRCALIAAGMGRDAVVLFVHDAHQGGSDPLFAALSACAQSAMLEYPRMVIRCIEVEDTGASDAATAKIITDELSLIHDACAVRYEEGVRFVRGVSLLDEVNRRADFRGIRDEGVYCITGGAGQLGFALARHIAQTARATILLIGRSAENNAIKEKVELLHKLGCRARYFAADVTRRDAVETLVDGIHREYGTISGIIHAAGIIDDARLERKTPGDMAAVIAPKILGTMLLDEATSQDPLDFFVLMSSIVSVTGNDGQFDYAFANAFMNHFASQRNMRRENSKRSGMTIAINWPLWETGGMRLADDDIEAMVRDTGLCPMPDEKGIAVFDNALERGCDQIIACWGYPSLVDAFLKERCLRVRPCACADDDNSDYDENLLRATEDYCVRIFSELLELRPEDVDPLVDFSEYGFDSILVKKFNIRIEKDLGPMSRTFLFECRNINALTHYLASRHSRSLRELLALSGNTGGLTLSPASHSHVSARTRAITSADRDIAIIGCSGRYPMARNIDEFWSNLVAGKNCITRVPASRWNMDAYYDPDPSKSGIGKIYCPWGGFVDDVDAFDQGLFSISPREAELIDPQERIFLEVVWALLEDAGYKASVLRAKGRESGIADVGVYVGVTTSTYSLLSVNNVKRGTQPVPYSSPWSIANRVSYFFDFNGPSMPVDTACSSSLTALHLACESLLRGESACAIAGGVNLYLHPMKYQALCQMRMLSSVGRSSAFGASADGFVPGEGVGAVLMKPRAAAERDGDTIYAIIKGTAINHGGRSNGYTVPNPRSQARLISAALTKAGVNPEHISYVEAHGTGTSLGDPIEIAGLSRAYEGFTALKNYCAIGSVKTNIGHAESAAGIAGLTKILLQMKYKKLVPSLHAEELNSAIEFSETPFFVQRELAEWRTAKPALAALSSFGAGGANAHVIVGEYIQTPVVDDVEGPEIIVLSAKSAIQVKAMAGALADYLKGHQGEEQFTLRNIAYTLQTGREIFEHRRAIVVRTYADCLEKLGLCAADAASSDIYAGCVGNRSGAGPLDEEDARIVVDRWMRDGRLDKLARFWAGGGQIDWDGCWTTRRAHRVGLPAYQFEKGRYWIVPDDATAVQNRDEKARTPDSGVLTGTMIWKEHALAPVSHTRKRQKVFIINNADERTKQAVCQATADAVLVTIGCGISFAKTTRTRYMIEGTSAGQWDELFHELDAEGIFPADIIYVASGSHEFQGGSGSQGGARYTNDLMMLFHILKTGAVFPKSGQLRIVYAYPFEKTIPDPVHDAVSGFPRSLANGGHDISVMSIGLDASAGQNLGEIASIECSNWTLGYGTEIRYHGVRRFQRMFYESALENQRPLIKRKGTYLITGGAGAIGHHLARHLVTRYGVNVLLCGRSPLSEKTRALCDELSLNGRHVRYVQADVADAVQMKRVLDSDDTRDAGGITGVIHAAGEVSAEGIAEKTSERFEEAIRAKIAGTLVLDDLLRNHELDLFVLFSSVASIVGDFGQCDYAVANRFLDSFAEYRNCLSREGSRKGFALSINWPLWRDGGMHLGNEGEKLYLALSGQRYLETGEGMDLFDKALSSGLDQVAIFTGDAEKIRGLINRVERSESILTGASDESAITHTVRHRAAAVLKMDTERLDIDENLSDYGYNSITLTQLAEILSSDFNIKIKPTLFYSHATVRSLARYLMQQPVDAAHAGAKNASLSIGHGALSVQPSGRSRSDIGPHEPIAIIGYEGIFPGADSADEFWRNCLTGKDQITEVPHERWDWRACYGDPWQEHGKTNIKWGGFIRDVDAFDARFFKIPPREAMLMDPQHRLYLQVVWKAIESAGYRVSGLSGATVGVFTGIQFDDYQKMIRDAGLTGAQVGTGNARTMVSNRISYLLNLRGPSESIDTACSSSLVALHRAVRALRSGECSVAVAGGVSLMLNPDSTIIASQIGMLSPDGKLKTFDRDANGYVKGEGVAAVLLKPLSAALRDGDCIHALVRGSAVNHGGKAASLTSPNAAAQADLIAAALRDAGIGPDTVSYMEMHGTGTALGDPIEVEGVSLAFAKFPEAYARMRDRGKTCGLGSVKSVIGHLEPAAGIAGVIKTICAFKHKTLPGIVNFKEINPYILHLEDTPLYIVQKARPWDVAPDRNGVPVPRRAGVSSFGFGGSNAHVVLEEFERGMNGAEGGMVPRAFVFSGRDDERLMAVLDDFISFCARCLVDGPIPSLSAIAYTLQTGREHFPSRLAVVASSFDELSHKLTAIRDGAEPLNGVYRGAGIAVADGQVESARSDIHVLCKHWVDGADIDWRGLYPDDVPERIKLPTYPFAKDRYWIPENEVVMPGALEHRLHPLIDHNETTEGAIAFTKVFHSFDYYVKDHVMGGDHIFPGCVFIEMALAAAAIFKGDRRPVRISSIVWQRPLIVHDDPVPVTIRLYPEKDALIYEAHSGTGENMPAHSRGTLWCAEAGQPGPRRIERITDIEERCGTLLEGDASYAKFAEAGMHYGERFRPLRRVRSNNTESIALLDIAPSLAADISGYLLHPVLLDGALQSTIALIMSGEAGAMMPSVPFAIGEITVCAPLTSPCYAWCRPAPGKGPRTFDIDIADPSGIVLASIRSFSMRELRSVDQGVVRKEYAGLVQSGPPQKLTDAGSSENPDLDFGAGSAQTQLALDIRRMVSLILGTREADIDPDDDISEYGFDSIAVIELSNRINSSYGIEITPAVFFEYLTINAFVRYLYGEYTAIFDRYYGCVEQSVHDAAEGFALEKDRAGDEPDKMIKPVFDSAHGRTERASTAEPIAVIGYAGIMPGCDSLDDFWNKLVAGKSMITEVPRERWDWRAYFGDPMREQGKTNVKWGGFIKDVDLFDPLFFGISPGEAELMDPQQRLFLQVVWHTIEHAGYRTADFSGTKTGLFVGVSGFDYYELLKNNGIPIEAHTATGITHSILANRISYLLNIHGPSEPIDTACSSSLVAIHRGVEALQYGTCDYVIAGGVNCIFTPSSFISFSKAGMLSPDGVCRAFDEQANGYVRGEGAGAVLLKPLSKAKKDGDTIYGIIRGSAVNHGGHAKSLTAPNPVAQAELIKEAVLKAGIDADTISYIEAHGTGTRLGDPVEINGLTRAFRELAALTGRPRDVGAVCGIGSVKTNIGHLETAAGIAGVLKVIMAMKHGMLPASINFSKLNSYINLADTPLYVVDSTREWLRRGDIPRRAGVSSFGFGGTNAHIIIEEYQAPARRSAGHTGPYVFLLSARNARRLREYASLLASFVATTDAPIGDIAYTLQVGRDLLDERLAFIAETRDEVHAVFAQFAENGAISGQAFTGNARADKAKTAALLGGKAGKDLIQSLCKDRDYVRLCSLWVMGADFGQEPLPGHEGGKRIMLPAYPFERVRCWVPEKNVLEQSRTSSHGTAALHPLVGANTSIVDEERFEKTLDSHEWYLRDHCIGGAPVFPGAAHIEMVRSCAAYALGDRGPVKMKNIIWAQPVTADQGNVNVRVSLHPEAAALAFELSVIEENNASRACSRGKVFATGTDSFMEGISINLEAIKKRCDHEISGDECYGLFAALGLEYGPGFQTIKTLWYAANESLARLELPETRKGDDGLYMLHPAILDGAFQSIIGLSLNGKGENGAAGIPFALGEIEFHGPLTELCYAHATVNTVAGAGVRRYDIVIADTTGRVLCNIKDFTVRAMSAGARAQGQQTVSETVSYYRTNLVETAQGSVSHPLPPSVLVFDEQGGPLYSFLAQTKGVDAAIVMQGAGFKKTGERAYVINPGSSDDYAALFEALGLDKFVPDAVVFGWSRAGFDSTHTGIHFRIEEGFFALMRVARQYLAMKHKKKLKILVVSFDDNDDPFGEALKGFARSLNRETQKIVCRQLVMDKSLRGTGQALALVANELCCGKDDETVVVIRNGVRCVERFAEHIPSVSERSAPGFREKGVYCITGGAGGLGLIFARYIASETHGCVVIAGRSPLDATITESLKGLRKEGLDVRYMRADVTEREQVRGLVGSICAECGSLHGIIHAAGIVRDSFVIKKSDDDAAAVIAPKIYGTVWLDEETSGLDLDFFAMFSSTSAVCGNPGQGDYAFANAFMDAYARRRERLRREGVRKGKTVSINWPLWADGGMRIDGRYVEWMKQSFGIEPLATTCGIAAFNTALQGDASSCIVLQGERDKINKSLGIEQAAVRASHAKPAHGSSAGEVEVMLIALCAELLKVNGADIDVDVHIGEYGVDSIIMMNMLDKLEAHYGLTIDPNALIEHPTIKDFAAYLTQEGIASKLSPATESRAAQGTQPGKDHPVINEKIIIQKEQKRFTERSAIIRTPGRMDTAVAVIGASCRFPGADTLESYWDTIREGRSEICKIPYKRWRDAAPSFDCGSIPQYGGFIDGIDLFDAGFFGISDSDALIMDPQHRILLELAQACIDRAGYRKDEINATRTAVCIGGGGSPYVKNFIDRIDEEHMKHLVVGSIQNMMASRISDFYNFTGVSQTIDTACSSSLVAIHQACASILSGECDMAIAGGIELLLDPFSYAGFAKAKVLTVEDRVRVFDERASGIMLGEGCGLVLLKGLEAARRDGDTIMAVVLGSAVNNDGHTMGLTIPNLEGQKAVIEAALEKSGINPETIRYLEAHGTGTLLGDPIEIKAATQVYRQYSTRKQFCAVGSVKSNIGHVLKAAGAAGFIKAMLALQNGMIPPTINCERPHPRFKFSESPFYPATALSRWDANGGRRRAAVSSFGFGGTNCHVILEEAPAARALRRPLVPTRFMRKRYWLGADISDSGASQGGFEGTFYLKLIRDIEAGRMSADAALQLIQRHDGRKD